MSRSGYSDDCEEGYACWRGAVRSALRGNRGQDFLLEMLRTLDALPEKKLIADDLARRVPPPFPANSVLGQIWSGHNEQWEVCAIGSVGRARGVDMSKLDPEDPRDVADAFGIAYAMACEIVWINDEAGPHRETPEARFRRVRAWIIRQIRAR